MNKVSAFLLAMSAAASWPAAAAQSAARPQAVREGERLAQIICDGCHEIGPNQPAEVVLQPPPPSFPAIANDPKTSAQALRRFITTTHWDERTFPMTMPNPLLMDQEGDEVVAYILSLRDPSAPPPPPPKPHPTAQAQRVDAGETLALRTCSLCHVVSSDTRYRPILDQQTPSFAQIANAPGMTAKSLGRFIARTHWDEKTIPMTMPNQELDAEETAEVVSYILSLRAPGRR